MRLMTSSDSSFSAMSITRYPTLAAASILMQSEFLLSFGCRIDDKRHYNVSEGDGDKTRISGEFMDCHDDKHVVTGVTHINMFSNDFFG